MSSSRPSHRISEFSSLSLVTVFATAMAVGGTSACATASGERREARDLYERGEHRAAERAADRELERAPEDPELWRLKINAAIRAGEHARGVDLYMRWHHMRRHYDDQALRSMAESVLYSALSHSDDVGVKTRAIEAIQRSGLASLDAQILASLDDGDARVAAAAAAVSNSERARARARELIDHPDPAVRARIVAAFARQGGQQARIAAALSDPAAQVRRAALRALARKPRAGERQRLLAMAQRDPDGAVRAAALNALRQSRGAEIVRAAHKALDDEHLGARLAGLSILARDADAHQALLQELARSNDLFVALRASLAVKKHGGEAPVRTLEMALAHGQWTVRVAGLNAVAEILLEREALAMIEARVRDERPEVRLAAARVLARLGQRGRALTILLAALEAPRATTRLEAATDLLRLDDASGREALEKLTRNADADTRRHAVEAHRFTDNPTLPLIRALGDDSADVRVSAATVLLALL